MQAAIKSPHKVNVQVHPVVLGAKGEPVSGRYQALVGIDLSKLDPEQLDTLTHESAHWLYEKQGGTKNVDWEHEQIKALLGTGTRLPEATDYLKTVTK